MDTPSDEQILTFESGGGGDFEWHTCAEITGHAGLCDGNDANDNTQVILDLGDDESNESTALTEISTVGDTNNAASEPSANEFQINFSGVWSGGSVTSTLATTSTGAATAHALAADPVDCSGGQLSSGIDTLGTAVGCTDAEEEAQVGTTNITGNAADDEILLGTAANAATWSALPNCASSTSKLLYNITSTAFTCGTDAGASGGGTLDIEEDNASAVASASSLDFGTGFDVNDDSGEADISLDFTEITTTTFSGGTSFTWTFDTDGSTDVIWLFLDGVLTLTSGVIGHEPGTEIDASDLTEWATKDSPGTINIGEAVYVTGYNVGLNAVTVELANAGSSATMPALGVAHDTFTNSTRGRVAISGDIFGFDTSAWAVGDALYVSTTAGQIDNVRPSSESNLVQKVGIVLRSHGSLGIITAVGTERANDLPNLDAAAIFVGDSSGQAQAVDLFGDATISSTGDLQISPDTILEIDLDFVDTPGDEEFLTFESGAGGDFEWHTCTELLGASICDGTDDGTSVALDLGDDGDDSAAIIRITTTGDTNGAATEPTADDFTINFSAVWSGGSVTSSLAVTSTGAATAAALASDPTDCAAGQWAGGIDALGTAQGCTVDDDTPDDDSEVPNTLTVDNASSVDPDALNCDVGDDNLISEDCFGDVLDAGEIEDIYVFVAGDIPTGVHDYGGADSFELPNATNGTVVDADGEITIDLRNNTTTAPSINIFASSTEWAILAEGDNGVLIPSVTTTDDFLIYPYRYPIEILYVEFIALGGETWTGNLVEYDASGVVLNDLFGDITVGAAWQGVNTFTDADIAAGSSIGIDTTSVSATVTQLTVKWYFRVKPER